MAKTKKPQLTHAKFTNVKIENMDIKQININIGKFKRATARRKSTAFKVIQAGNLDMQKGYDILNEAIEQANNLIKRHEKTKALKVLSKAYFNPYTSTKTLKKAMDKTSRENRQFLRQLGVNTRKFTREQNDRLADLMATVLEHGYYTYEDVVNASDNVEEITDFLEKHSNEKGEELIDSFVAEFGLEEMI